MRITPEAVKSLLDTRRPGSLASRMRRRRFELFRSLLSRLERPVTVLDIGGTEYFWETMGYAAEMDVRIVLLNLYRAPVRRPGFRSVVGDAREMPRFGEDQFDVVFSNSVIEHVGDFEQQRRMAAEIRRVGKRFFVQTPNRYFPIEPHFLLPGYQFLPFEARVFLLRHFELGWVGRIPDPVQAAAAVREVRLLDRSELEVLFPGARIYRERFCGLTKSFIVYGGWGT